MKGISMGSKYKIVATLLLYIYHINTVAQVKQEKIALSDVLLIIQKKYNCQFAYADEHVEDITVPIPSENLTYQESLTFLRKKTKLIFKPLKDRYIIVKPHTTPIFICGYINDKDSNQPIEHVTIIGENNHAITNADGYFKLEVASQDESFVVRRVGYNTLSLLSNEFKHDDCIKIQFTKQIEALSEIVISNVMATGIDKLADGSYNINFVDFGILPGLIESDVLQTIQSLPGIQSINETVSNINIRGGTNDQNLLLWDGIKMYQSGHFFGLISVFNPLITTNVSVIKNGTSVDLSDGISGTIAMKTSTALNSKFAGSIGSNFVNADVFVDIPLGEKSSIQVSSRKAINDFVETTPTYDNYFERVLQDTEVLNSNADFDFYDTSLRWIYKFSDDDFIRVNFINVNNELVIREAEDSHQNKQLRESSLIQNSMAGGVFYQKNWNTRLMSSVLVSETDYTLKAVNKEGINPVLTQKNGISETSVKLNTWYKYNNQLTLFTGYNFTETGVTNLLDKIESIIRIEKSDTEVIREHALFVQTNYASASEKTLLKAGIRYNYIEKFRQHIFEPRFSINQKIANHFELEVSGEIKHQSTTQIINFQTDFLGVEKRRWRLANGKNVPVITSQQVSLGLNYDFKRWRFSIEGYHKLVNSITAQSQGFLNQYIFEKAIGSYMVTGLDFLINRNINRWSTWLSYSIADNEYTFAFDNFKELNFPNNLDVTHATSFGISYTTKKLNIAAGLKWHTGKPSTNPVEGKEIIAGQINYRPANSSRIKAFMRFDASITYDFNISKGVKSQVGFSVWNGLDKDNIINSYYKINNNDLQHVVSPALSFTPNMLFKVYF